MQNYLFRRPAYIMTATCLMFTLVGCGGDDDMSLEQDPAARGFSEVETEAPAPVQPVTVVQAAVDDGRFTTLVAALQATGLDGVLSAPDANFTVFAPTDDAFAQLPEGTLDVLLAPEGLPVLSDILLYHVISDLPEAVPADVAVNLAMQGAPANQIPMANGDTVSLTLDGPMQALFVNDSQVIITDLITDNGIIHVIDAVLSPPEEMNPEAMPAPEQAPEGNQDMVGVDMGMNIEAPICEPAENPDERSLFQAIADEPDLTTLTALLEVTGLNEVLRNVFADAEYTVFAPTDAAFGVFVASLGAEIEDQVAVGGVDALAEIVGVDTLQSILLYHVLGLSADAATALSLANSDIKTDRILATLNGDAIQLSSPDQQRLFVNMSEVTCTDIGAKNGIVHKVDAVIQFPNSVDIVHVAALKPELSTFYDLVKLTDLDHLLRASTEVTVLAPTNDAFGLIPQETLDYLLSDAGRSDLVQILKQHIVIQQPIAGDARITAEIALSANGVMLETAAGSDVTLTVRVAQDGLSIGGSPVIDTDILATNGVIHTLGTVIVSPH